MKQIFLVFFLIIILIILIVKVSLKNTFSYKEIKTDQEIILVVSALRTIQQALLMYMMENEKYPETINKKNLNELKKYIRNSSSLLSNFKDEKLDDFQSSSSGYIIIARSKEKNIKFKATLDGIWILTNNKWLEYKK